MTDRAVGVDGTRGGWAVVVLADGGVERVLRVADLATVVDLADGAPIAVDIPIGLVDAPRRAADVAARRQLAGSASSVFPAPCRTVVDAYRAGQLPDHAAANALSRSASGAGLSRQTWNIVDKIAEADAVVERGQRLYEVHPELSFRLLTGRALGSKRTWNGVIGRLVALRSVGIKVPEEVPDGARMPVDDVIDAAIVAWTAAGTRTADGLRSHPERPTEHDRGLPIAIWTRDSGT